MREEKPQILYKKDFQIGMVNAPYRVVPRSQSRQARPGRTNASHLSDWVVGMSLRRPSSRPHRSLPNADPRASASMWDFSALVISLQPSEVAAPDSLLNQDDLGELLAAGNSLGLPSLGPLLLTPLGFF